MMEQFRGLPSFSENVLPTYSSGVVEICQTVVPLFSKRPTDLNDLPNLPDFFRQFIIRENLTLNLFTSVSECINTLPRFINNSNDSNILKDIGLRKGGISSHSPSLIIFVTLIGCVSLISIIGNLCLAKVLYSKRYRLIQTDRIVLCLALSELCLVLIDTPTEIYRFLSPSFTQEWLCRSHTFFEALFSSCIIFYHLLGAVDRFVYIHGHISSDKSCWSRWCRRISTQSGSIILLILPIICSLPLAICNFLHANLISTSPNNKTCTIQYTDGILIGLLISFYILPLLLSFFLHAKLVYFIRTRHNQHYLATAYVLQMKRNNTIEFQSKRRMNQENLNGQDRSHLQPKRLLHRRFMTTNTETHGSTTTTTLGAIQSAPLNPNNSSNSSQSSRSSTGTSSTSITSPIVLYKINSQANANANRTVLLLVLLLSFYVFCWAPYNIYTWLHVYRLTQSTNSKNNSTLFNDLNQTSTTTPLPNLSADLRRIIYINYSLYLLSMISMCFSFIFYFSLNKQARNEFSRFIGCICPWIIHIRNGKQRQKYPKQQRQLQCRTRFQNQNVYNNDRIKKSPSALLIDPYKHMNYPKNGTSKRTVLNYGCQIQCCP